MASRKKFYELLHSKAQSYLANGSDFISVTANISALAYRDLRETYGEMAVKCVPCAGRRVRPDESGLCGSWLGFYLVRKVDYTTQGSGDQKDDEAPSHVLTLGPFHGKPAVPRIPFGRGVCGQTAANNCSTLVPDVHNHPDHIACDR